MVEYKVPLVISSLFNLIFLAIAIVLIHRRGGLSYLILKFNHLFDNYKSRQMYDSPFYRDKKSHFENLPKIEQQIVFLGDSLTDLCEWSEIFQDQRIINRGICGDTTAGILNRIGNIIEYCPQKLFLMIGINDLNQGVPVSDIAGNYKLMLETFKSQIPNAKIFVQSLLPINQQFFGDRGVNEKVVALNAKIKELAENYSFQYIDLFTAFLDNHQQLAVKYTTDGVHLNGQGYLVWKEIIEKYVVD